MSTQKTLYEIIVEVLSQFSDANLASEEAKHRIADEVCNLYYDEIEPDIIDHQDFDLEYPDFEKDINS